MNVSEQNKAVFWLLPRTGSRSISSVISHMGFVNLQAGVPLEEAHSHAIGLPNGCENYHITSTVRNPYSWVLSYWHLWGDGHTFEDFVENCDVLGPYRLLESIKAIREPDVWVRYEHMEQDLLKVHYVRNGDDPCRKRIGQFVHENVYWDENHQGVLRRSVKDPRYTDYLSYYTGSGLDRIYKLYEEYFEKFSYQREYKTN